MGKKISRESIWKSFKITENWPISSNAVVFGLKLKELINHQNMHKISSKWPQKWVTIVTIQTKSHFNRCWGVFKCRFSLKLALLQGQVVHFLFIRRQMIAKISLSLLFAAAIQISHFSVGECDSIFGNLRTNWLSLPTMFWLSVPY